MAAIPGPALQHMAHAAHYMPNGSQYEGGHVDRYQNNLGVVRNLNDAALAAKGEALRLREFALQRQEEARARARQLAPEQVSSAFA